MWVLIRKRIGSLEIFLIVVLSVLLVAVLPGWAASRVAPSLALEE